MHKWNDCQFIDSSKGTKANESIHHDFSCFFTHPIFQVNIRISLLVFDLHCVYTYHFEYDNNSSLTRQPSQIIQGSVKLNLTPFSHVSHVKPVFLGDVPISITLGGKFSWELFEWSILWKQLGDWMVIFAQYHGSFILAPAPLIGWNTILCALWGQGRGATYSW